MSELVADCPRCGANRITFDLVSHAQVGVRYSWQKWYEVFCICRHCNLSTVFVVSEKGTDEAKVIQQKSGLNKIQGSVNSLVSIESFVSLKDRAAIAPPEHLPEDILSAFTEGATCMAVGCFNAAGTMFRLCVDLATQSLLPESGEGLNKRAKRELGLRLPWLFQNKLLPESLNELSLCIKEDGNDGAHRGSLKSEDAQDILDFTILLLERLYTEPKRLNIAKERREQRRQG